MSKILLEVFVDSSGQFVKFIHDDEVTAALEDLGELKSVKRASHVEPNPSNPREWLADMSPVCPGVILGPFKSRSEALQAETEWLSNQLSGNTNVKENS